jgi:rSAM-associated Gly-rich repeat protein
MIVTPPTTGKRSKETGMPRHNPYLRLLTALLPAGAFGLSIALASTAAKATPTEGDKPRADDGTNRFSIADELKAIRDGVDEARAEMQGGESGRIDHPDIRLAWWLNNNGLGWGNGGARWGNGGYPAWGNVRPWGNGGWRNAAPWHNGWHNWHNGGWRNF